MGLSRANPHKIIFGHSKKNKFSRFWFLISKRESISRPILHGKIHYAFIYLACRVSCYFLRIYKLTGFGKGILSRSEPIFRNPNPCFNSIGRASRESLFFQMKNKKISISEISKVEFVESLYLQKNKILNLCGVRGIRFTQKVFCKLDPEFFWNYWTVIKNRNKKSFLKPGVKFGGSFVIYRGKLTFLNHIHSKSIMVIENFHLTEDSCKKCFTKMTRDWKNFQNKVRLAHQVSKKITLINFIKKKSKKKKSWICIEFNFQRWIPKKKIFLF